MPTIYEFPSLDGVELASLDTETTGLSWLDDRVFAFSMSFADRDLYWDLRECPQAIDWLKAEIRKPKKLALFNQKFDAHMLLNHGVELPHDICFDTAIAAALLNEHEDSFSLEALAEKYTDERKLTGIYEELADLFGGKANKSQMSNIYKAPIGLSAPYAKADTRATLALAQWQLRELRQQQLERVQSLEQKVLPVLMRIERFGVRVDIEAAEKAVVDVTEMIERRQAKLDAEAGKHVNANSSKQLQDLLRPVKRKEGRGYELPDGTFVPETKKGAPSMNKDVLAACSIPAAKLITGLKQAQKTRDTFLLGHILGNHRNGRIHANFNQTKKVDEEGDEYGATSGRLSCNNPNLQQISARNPEMATIVRGCFMPELGQLWGCRDWKQMDFRIMAHYLDNRKINEAYDKDPLMDFHQLVADMTGLPRKPTPGIKGDAKAINLGLCFGMGQGRMAKEMGLPYTEEERRDGSVWLKAGPEAEAVFAKYHAAVPGVKAMLQEMTSVAKSRGFVRTGYGRRIRFPGGDRTYAAGAMIFQGTAADALKMKLVEVDAILQGTGSTLLLNVHDEFDTSLDPGAKGQELSEAIRKAVETFDEASGMPLNIPIRSSVGFGPNWWKASKE